MSDIHPDKLAFLAHLEANPRDEVAHRAFADWLLEHGEDDEADFHLRWTPQWQDAKERLVALADRIDAADEAPHDWEDLDPRTSMMKKFTLNDLIKAGRVAKSGGYSGAKNLSFGAESIMEDEQTRLQFWEDWSVYTRTEINDENRCHSVFMCCY